MAQNLNVNNAKQNTDNDAKVENEIKEEENDANICRSVVPHASEQTSINSKAVVKFQIVQSPANFAQLRCNTDLKLPPSNWLMTSLNAYGLRQTMPHPYGFTSLRMADMFPDCVGGVDVVSSAENIKNILKLPYSPKSTISLMVHRIENTLLIDEFDLYRFLLRQADTDWPWLKTFLFEQGVNTDNKLPIIKNKSREALQKKNLLSKFLYHSLALTDESDDNVHKAESEMALALDSFNRNASKLRVVHSVNGLDPDLPEPDMDENVPRTAQTNNIHNRNVVWTFEDIRMLIGTDMPIFGSDTRPCISLRLRDMTEPINVLTGIDYWLDNLMCNVPEVVMCYHLDGFVQKYEIIKTEDLPHLEDSNFSPQAIRNVAQHILAFLKQKATKAGHTYWLFKGRNDDFVKLYDLTSLSMGKEETPNSAEAKPNENPFTVPVAMLLYKVAKNMKNMNPNMSVQQAGSIKALLDNCIKLLPKKKYPQIVTSSHYILSDLYIPIGLDPNSPNGFFSSSDSDTQSVYDDEKYQSEMNNHQNDHIDDGLPNDSLTDRLTDSISMKSIRDSFSEMDKNWKHNQTPPPLTNDIEERCQIALQHIAEGLNCLQYFSMNEEKLTLEKEEMAKMEEKQRIIYEELNPTMAKSSQAIPMPYTTLDARLAEVNPSVAIPMGWTSSPSAEIISKKSKKSRKKSNKSASKIGDTDSSKLLQVKPQPEVIMSWNLHLKLLLLEKACLVYEVLSKQYYQSNQYGKALKYILTVMKCQRIVSKYMPAPHLLEHHFQLELAGDCYYQLSRNLDTIQCHLIDFKTVRDIDQSIMQEILKELNTNGIDLGQFPDPVENVEFLMLNSCLCYEKALNGNLNKDYRHQLISRIGCVRNDLGAKYLMWAEEEYNKFLDRKDNDESEKTEQEHTMPMYQSLAKKSFDSIMAGIGAFKEIGDNINQSIVLCTLGRFWRVRAYMAYVNGDISQVKKFYEDSFASYQKAFAVMQSKDENPQLWDIITWELSTSRLGLAQQLSSCQLPAYEQTIIDLLLNTLKMCETSNEIKYLVRVGVIYDQLATIYRNAYKRELNDLRKKNLLQLTRKYYEKATRTYEEVESPKLYIEVLNKRIDLQDELCNGVQNAVAKMKHLQMGLDIAQQSSVIFQKIIKDQDFADDLFDVMIDFEKHLQNLLKTMVKLSLGKGYSDRERNFHKKCFAFSLRAKVNQTIELLAGHLLNLLTRISEEYAALSSNAENT